MIGRSQNFKTIPLNLVGSSVFGRYAKIDQEKTYNMFQSDSALVPYAGYEIAIYSNMFRDGRQGRGIYTSIKFNRIVTVIDNNVFLVELFFRPGTMAPYDNTITYIGSLGTSTGVVYITENNKPQILISDNQALYLYDPTGPTQMPVVPIFRQITGLNFTPGFVTFHDTYFLCAASNDSIDGTINPPVNNSWRVSQNNDGSIWLNDAASVGFLQTKPDNVKAVVRFPSKGNMIFVMGQTVTEAWFDIGAQLFPYQRQTQFNIDYGCLNAATVAYLDQMVVWLAYNEKSGPIVMYSDGGEPIQITTDGFDYVFAQLSAPEDSQGFLYRQDGHLFYHLNFYTDNLSLFYDFNLKKIYHACDQNLNYFIASQVTYFNNQYYFVSKNSGNLYSFDTIFTTYQDTDAADNTINYEIPRIRTCKNIRLPSQEYFIANDIGFTIETGETDYQHQDIIPTGIVNSTPCVDLAISRDGGATFGSDYRYVLNPIGQRKNKLQWWQCGLANDMVCKFTFSNFGRVVIFDGEISIRQ